MENGCDSVCTCLNGKMECGERCTGVFIEKGKKIEDPLCTTRPAEDDPCCSVMVCAADTETEPLEICSHGNKTYSRGDSFRKGCEEVCTCDAGGSVSCKPRCAPLIKSTTADGCVEGPDPQDPCCRKMFCDVTLGDRDEPATVTIASAKFVNDTTVLFKFDGDKGASGDPRSVEVSADRAQWTPYRLAEGGYLGGLNKTIRYARIEGADDTAAIEGSESGCSFRGNRYRVEEEFNDGCTALCVCKSDGVRCLKLDCPTYFGTDVLDPNCVEWETVPKNFSPVAPNCCPEKLRCVGNGSCAHEGVTYQNWQQLPLNVTGCEKRCYCEMGSVECQNTCPPVTAVPPPTLGCPPSHARLGHVQGDDCCKYWVCDPPEPPSSVGKCPRLV